MLPAAAQTAPSFNLSSTQHSFTANNSHPATIIVGGSHLRVSSGNKLTPAEMVALTQVLSTGRQSILLGARGNAVSGRVSLINDAGNDFHDLLIPRGLTALAAFNTGGSFNVAGGLTNGSKLFAYTNNPSITSATFNVGQLYNLPGAVFSSLVPPSLSAFTGHVYPLSLSINAASGVRNQGTLASSADLNFNSAGNIAINNQGGTLFAARDINLRDAAFAGKLNTNLSGGNVSSRNLNVFSGNGTADINVNRITSVINIDAGIAHVCASTPDLKLGNMNISGDPTFYNYAGDVVLGGTITTLGQPLAVVASGNIRSTTAPLLVNTSSAGSASGAVTLIAGANMIPDQVGNAGQRDPGSAPPAGSDGVTLTITGPSATGGSVDLTAANGVSINTGGNSLSDAGGSVTVVAFAGADAGSGRVLLPASSSIQTGGDVAASGDVKIYAGALNGTGIQLGMVDTSLAGVGTPGTGAVIARTSTPSVAGPMTVIDGVVSGTFLPSLTRNASVITGAIATANAPVTIIAGKDVVLGTGNPGTITTNGGNVGIIAGENITTNGVNAILTTGGGSVTTSGNIVMAAGVSSRPNGTDDGVSIVGTSITGGNIDLTQNGGVATFRTSAPSGATAGAGSITLFAERGNNSTSGQVLLPVTTTVAASGDAAGPTSNGDITIQGGSAIGTAVSVGSINIAGGSPGTGSVSIRGGQLTAATFPLTCVSGNLFGSIASTDGSSGLVSAKAITADGGAVNVISGGDLSASTIVDDLSAGSANLPTVVLKANGGTLTLGGDISASNLAAGGAGGTVNLTGETLAPVVHVAVRANGDGDGGQITVKSTGSGSTVNIDSTGSGNLSLTAQSGASGSVTVESAGDIKVVNGSAINVAPSTATSARGGNITLTAGTAGQGNVSIAGDLQADADGASGDMGGQITINVTSTVPFDVGNGSINGAGGLLTARGGTGQLGGGVQIQTFGAGGINLSSPGNIQVVGSNGWGGGINLLSASTISGGGTLTIDGGLGSVQLVAKSFNFSSAFTISANGTTTAASAEDGGGIISIVSQGFGPGTADGGTITVGSSTGNFIIHA
jgi:hypothetical protein